MSDSLMRILSMLWLTLAGATALLTAACSSDGRVVANSYHHISEGVWDTQDTASFTIDSLATDGYYQLSVALRTTNEIQYQKIFIVAEQSYSNPALSCRDTIAVQLTDEAGNIQGDGLGLYNYIVPLDRMINLHKGQSGTIKIGHIMRCTRLSGIVDVGIKLTYEDSSN